MHYTKQKVGKKEFIKPISGIFISLKSGLVGFSIVFSFIIFTKMLLIITHPSKLFIINLNDLIISSWGFLIISFIVFVVKNKSNN